MTCKLCLAVYKSCVQSNGIHENIVIAMTFKLCLAVHKSCVQNDATGRQNHNIRIFFVELNPDRFYPTRFSAQHHQHMVCNRTQAHNQLTNIIKHNTYAYQ